MFECLFSFRTSSVECTWVVCVLVLVCGLLLFLLLGVITVVFHIAGNFSCMRKFNRKLNIKYISLIICNQGQYEYVVCWFVCGFHTVIPSVHLSMFASVRRMYIGMKCILVWILIFATVYTVVKTRKHVISTLYNYTVSNIKLLWRWTLFHYTDVQLKSTLHS